MSMAESFRIMRSITQIAPREFVVIVTALHDPPLGFEWTRVLQSVETSLQGAEAKRDELANQLKSELTAEGHQVVGIW